MSSTVAVFRRGDRLSSGKVFCYARLDGRPVRIVERRFKVGLATCSWRLPASSRGKLVQAVVVVGQGPKRVRASFRSWIF